MANVQQDKELMKLLQGAVGAGAKSAFPWSSLVSGLFSLGSSALGYAQNQQNIKAQREANQQNIALTREANSAQMRESEKAYQRSIPTNQVANFRAAGMSHAGALQALSGGGAYSPAPVNTGQVEPVQGSSAGVQQGIESMVQALMQQQSNATQLKIAREQMKAQMEIARSNSQTQIDVARINQESSNYGADVGYKGTQYASDRNFESSLISSFLNFNVGMANVHLGKEELAEKIRQYNDMSPLNKSKIRQEIAESKARADLLSKQALAQKWENTMFAKEYRIILDNWDKIKENAGLEYDNDKAFLQMQKSYNDLMDKYYSSDKAEFDVKFREEIKIFGEFMQAAGQFYLGNKIAGKKTPKVTRTITSKSKGRTIVDTEYDNF